jgi:hypothetical protein
LSLAADRPRAIFIIDSSRRLNSHSNFLHMIAWLEAGHPAAAGAPDPGSGCGAINKGEAEMAGVETNGAVLSEVPAGADACYELGMMYSAGREVPIDMVSAHKWFNIAAMRGHKDATALRREIAAQMSDREIGLAQRAARDWLKEHPEAPQASPEKTPDVRVAA